MDYFRIEYLDKDVDGFMLTTSLQKKTLVLFLISLGKLEQLVR
jgi:hypothetical protein